MVKMVGKGNTVSKNKKAKNPYGIFKGSTISKKDIDAVIFNWDKVVDELVETSTSKK